MGSGKQRCTIAQGLFLSSAKDLDKAPVELSPTGSPITGGVG